MTEEEERVMLVEYEEDGSEASSMPRYVMVNI